MSHKYNTFIFSTGKKKGLRRGASGIKISAASDDSFFEGQCDDLLLALRTF